MDAHNFDAAARVFASGASRRQALRLLAVGALGALLPRRGLAAPAGQDDGCDAGLTYCEEQPNWAPAGCYDLSSDYLHCGECMHQCPSAGPVEMACIGGACTVTGCGDLTDCTGNLDCTDLNSDPAIDDYYPLAIVDLTAVSVVASPPIPGLVGCGDCTVGAPRC